MSEETASRYEEPLGGYPIGARRIVEAIVEAAELRQSDAAVLYAVAGVPVFPVAAGEKRPLTPAGFYNATTNLGTVRRWWERWPQANIGLPTGGDGVEVVDVDRKGDRHGFDALADARRQGLIGTARLEVATPSGGRHLYYAAHPDRVQSCWTLAPAKIDFRGTGGYVLVPPSIVTGRDGDRRDYQIRRTTTSDATVDAGRLRNMLRPPPPLGHSHTPGLRSLEETTHRLAGWLATQEEGNRNNGLFWATCRLVEAGVAHADAEPALHHAAASVGLGDREIATTIASAYRSTHPHPAAQTPTISPSAMERER